MKQQDTRDCNITRYEGVKDVKILPKGSDEVFNLDSKNVWFDVVSINLIGRRSISGHIQDPQLLEPLVLLSSVLQMTGTFRDVNLGTNTI